MGDVTPQSMTILTRRGHRKARAEAPSVVRSIRFAPSELEVLEKAASVNRQTLSDFARDAIVTAAADCLEDSQT